MSDYHCEKEGLFAELLNSRDKQFLKITARQKLLYPYPECTLKKKPPHSVTFCEIYLKPVGMAPFRKINKFLSELEDK